LHVLRALEFNAVSSAGLDQISIAGLRKLLPTLSDYDRSFKFRLILVDWDVAGMADVRRDRAGRIIRRLADAQRAYYSDPGRRFAVWRPGVPLFEEIRIAASFRDGDKIRELLWTNLPTPTIETDWQLKVVPNQLSIAMARTKLQQAIQSSAKFPHVAEVSHALEHYLDACHRMISRRLYDGADDSKSPTDCFTYLAIGELADHWIDSQSPVLAARAIIAGQHPGEFLTMSSERRNEQHKLTTQMHKLIGNAFPRKT
jgi:hypothetical protein